MVQTTSVIAVLLTALWAECEVNAQSGAVHNNVCTGNVSKRILDLRSNHLRLPNSFGRVMVKYSSSSLVGKGKASTMSSPQKPMKLTLSL